MRAPVDTIQAPELLPQLRWVNAKLLRMDRLLGRPVLIEFWDFCRPNSIRTLPYLKEWNERYGGAPPDPRPGGDPGEGLQIVGIHSPGFEPSHGFKNVRAAVERLGISYPVLVDDDLEMWRVYENEGWPARYLFEKRGMLQHFHFGEGAYEETELAIQELLGIEREPTPPLRLEDAPGAELIPQTEDQPGAYNGPYEAGAAWAVLDGTGTIGINGGASDGGRELVITHPGAYPLVEHERHTEGVLELQLDPGLQCVQTCFLPGVA